MKRFMVGFILLSFRAARPTIAGRVACVLVAMLLTCASSVNGQVIEEAGLPVKGNDVSRESFSLSCPSRFVTRAGESIPLSCVATGVSEEGVRYEWESISGEGFRLLSTSNELSPFFTAPVPGAGAEYTYRLTATGPGVYRTATVTVSVQGVSGEPVREPGLQEDCDPLAIPDEPGQGCAEDRGPVPFGFGFEEEEGFLLPEAPGAPDRGGGTDLQAPPRLECPVAVFMEELETGAIECHAWDAAGEQYLEYSWEPTGNTTRAYLDNPRLIPEDSPHPSVIAPETPSYETLESFRSGDRTFRYRYRLTATSRATGLSSHEEVEVYVSSSRPVVYCPLEVAVEEGETVTLDCEGADPLSFRMDYDEEEASVLWEWEGLWGTSTAPLDATELSSPLFTAPVGSAGKEYHYIASMTTSASGVPRTARRRVTVRVAGAEGAEQASAPVSKGNAPSIECEEPADIYEATEDFALDCTATEAPDGATYSWTGTDVANRLSATTVLTPTFLVPPDINEPDEANKNYEYTVTMTSGGIEQASEDVTVTVLEKPDITVTCEDVDDVDEDAANIEFECEASGAPGENPYTWSWSPTTHLTGRDTGTPTFDVPDSVDKDTTWTYTVTASAENAEDGDAEVTVTVRDTDVSTAAKLEILCDYTEEVYAGDPDVSINCRLTIENPSPSYRDWTWGWVHCPSVEDCPETGGWEIRGDNTRFSQTIISGLHPSRLVVYWPVEDPHPAHSVKFEVPEEVDAAGETWRYRVYGWGYSWFGGAYRDDPDKYSSTIITIRVVRKPDDIAVNCTDPGEVHEGAPDIAFDCSASGGAPGASINYSWSSPGAPADTSLLSATDVLSPTFDVPEDVSQNTMYTYTLTASADGQDDATDTVTVTVLNRVLSITCTDPSPQAYEGSDEITLACSASGAAPGVAYAYSWSSPGAPADTSRLSATNVASPAFDVPDNVDSNTTYEYLLTATAAGATAATETVTVTVLNRVLSITCTDTSPQVYEGSDNITLACSASGAAPGVAYAYSWSSPSAPADTSRLSATNVASPVFDVPDNVNSNTTYEYLLTVSAGNATLATETVTVTVLNKGALAVACADPGSVYEGSEDIAFDCSASGAPGDNPQYAYAWTASGDTQDTSLLSATDIASPTFYVPNEVPVDTTFSYALTVSAENAEDATQDVTVTVLNKGALAVACADPGSVYEGSEDIAFDCSASGAPGDNPQYAYAWTASGDTQDTSLLSAADIASPTFHVPEEVNATTIYEYLLTVSAENATLATETVTVTVLNTGALAVACADPGSVYEGSEDITFDCSASGAPSGSTYDYAWTARGDTRDTSLLSAADIASPTFYVPDNVVVTATYEYRLTASAENAENGSARVTVTVLNKGALAVACADPGSVYEGSEDITFDCSASGAPSGSTYDYVWTARGDTQDTSLLSAADIASPTFYVPEDVAATTTYEYRLTASAANAEDGSARVTVTVLNKSALAVACADPGSVYEGSDDIAFDCSSSGAPSGSTYDYAWTARGDTRDTLLLSAADIASPTFYVPDNVVATTTYEYLFTASAENAENGSVRVAVTVLNKGALAVACADPGSVYEGSADFALDCSASGAPAGSAYTYAWTAQGDTQDTALLSATDVAAPAFYVPDAIDVTTTYEYLLTVSAENAESGSAEVTITILNKPALAVACADPGSAYEGSDDVAFDCSASGAPAGSAYTYAWTARGDTQDTSLLSATDIASPTFYVPDEIDATTTYEYRLTVSAANAEGGSVEATVTVLNKEALAVVCADPGSVYEGSENIAFDCEASGAPGDDPQYAYAWTARGDTQDTVLLSATDIAAPAFYVPDAIDVTTTYEYLLTASAQNAEDATAEVSVTVLNRAVAPPSEPVSPPVEEPPVDSPPLASSSSTRAPSDPSSLGVTASASPLRFGVQSADAEVALDPATDGISTYMSGPYHAGRMTLSPGGSEAFDENGEMDLSIELVSPVVLKRADAIEASLIVLTPSWSLAESCEQLSSQAIGGLYTETTLSEDACRLLRFGGELDLTGAPSGQYAGSIDLILRSGEREETHSVEVSVTVVPAQRVITIGPGGVRFGTSRELPVGLTEEQNLSIYPDMAFLTEEQPHGVFELSNPSLVPLEVSVSARFGYTEATENGREVVVEDPSASRLGDLSEAVDIHPGVLVLQPGEKGLIRYGVKEGAHREMAEKGYAAFFDVVSQPRRYADLDRMPEEVTGDRTARVTMRVPGVYVPREGASQLRATLLSVSYLGSMSATFLLETADHPFAGEVVAYDGDGRELGRGETLVYTRSRVRIPLARMPEEETVFLRFSPRGSDRAPLPASVEWNAPRRDIGAAGNKDGSTTSQQVLVRKP